MIKLITICLLITASYSVKAQTLEQTMDYINVNLQNYLLNKQSTQVFARGIDGTNSDWQGLRSHFTRLFMADIKSVDYSIIGCCVQITATGECYAFKNEKPNYDNVAPNSISIWLQKSTPIENVKRIIKAMKHAAELEGAKLINDDLFKN